MSMAYPGRPGFEKRETSYAAAQSVNAESLRDLVMKKHGEYGGLTDEELDNFRPHNCPTLRPRRCELTLMGLLVDTGQRRLSGRGKQMIVWGAAPSE